MYVKIKTLLFLLGASAILSLTACATKQERIALCTGKDWYEIGRRDGVQGAPSERMKSYQKECGDGFGSEQELLYSNGRNAGLVEYCDKANAFDLGRMGATYHNVCPSLSEKEFLQEYRRGQQARQKELNQKIDQARVPTSNQMEEISN